MAPTLDAAISLPATALGVRAARTAVDAAVRRLSRDDDLLRAVAVEHFPRLDGDEPALPDAERAPRHDRA